MAFKSYANMSREFFNVMLTVVGSLLPTDHVLPKNLYECQKLIAVQKTVFYLGKITRMQINVQSATPPDI